MRNKVWLYTLCYNEMPILPFMVDYWKRICEKVIVYDNGSNDGSREYLAQFPFVEVRDFHIGEKFNDTNNKNMKNEAWKEAKGKCDYVIVCDMDEVLWHKDIDSLLDDMTAKGETYIKPQGYEMYSQEFPTYIEGKLLHEQCYMGVAYHFESKCILFNPNKITKMNYDEGAHHARPNGIVRLRTKKDTYLLHYKKLGEDYLVNKYNFLNNRLSDENKKHKWGIHYTASDEKKITVFRKGLAEAKDLRNIL